MIAKYSQVAAVSESWDSLKRIKGYQEKLGVALFKEMFEIAPNEWGIFPWGKGDCQDEGFFTDPQFLVFAKNFVGMLDMAIDMLGPDMEIIQEQLEGLGASHRRYGVTPKHFEIMGQALVVTLEAMLKESFNEKTKKSWEVVYAFMSGTMIKAVSEAGH